MLYPGCISHLLKLPETLSIVKFPSLFYPWRNGALQVLLSKPGKEQAVLAINFSAFMFLSVIALVLIALPLNAGFLGGKKMSAKFISQNFIYPKVQLALAQLSQLLLQPRGRGVAVKKSSAHAKQGGACPSSSGD